MGYHCGSCGKAVTVLAEGERTVIVRSCSCDAPILMDLAAELSGEGRVSDGGR